MPCHYVDSNRNNVLYYIVASLQLPIDCQFIWLTYVASYFNKEINVYNDLVHAIENGQVYLPVLLHLRTAFDT